MDTHSNEKIVWAAPASLPGVEILSVENNRRPWCVYHETYSFCNIDRFVDDVGDDIAGEAVWVYRKRLHENHAQSMMLLEPGEIHRNTKTPTTCNFGVTLIDSGLVDEAAREVGMGAGLHFRQAVAGNPAVYRAFARLHTALKAQTSLLHLQTLLVQCIDVLLREECERVPAATAHAGGRRMQWAREYLAQHFAEEIPLQQLADIAGVSRFHFLRMFAQEFGLPPHAYQMQLRIDRVGQLLKIGFPLHSIEAGYADQSHLIRHFKKIMGVTPGRYAAMVCTRPLTVNVPASVVAEQ